MLSKEVYIIGVHLKIETNEVADISGLRDIQRFCIGEDGAFPQYGGFVT